MPKACTACKSTKKVELCGVCESPVCQKCAQYLPKHSFPLLPVRPPELHHDTYCGPCYVSKIGPIEEEYARLSVLAAKVLVFPKAKAEQTRLMDKREKPLSVEDCEDERDVLLKLAYLAAKEGFNALIYVHVAKKQVRNHAYQTSRWTGHAIPTKVDEAKLRPDY